MPTNHTTNYQLNQWVKSDQVRMEDFNADNAKLDAALKAHDTSLASKATTSALNSLKATVNTKASQSALDALSATVSGHTATLAKKGNCRVYTTSYTGDGKNDAYRSVTFPSKPWAVFVGGINAYLVLVRGVAYASVVVEDTLYKNSVTWSGNSVSWYNSIGAGVMMNANGVTYQVVALLQTD